MIVVAVGVYFAFGPLGLTDGYAGLILAHTTLGVPLVVITVLAALAGFDRTLIRVAESLGASRITTFRRWALEYYAAKFRKSRVGAGVRGQGPRTGNQGRNSDSIQGWQDQEGRKGAKDGKYAIESRTPASHSYAWTR